MQHETLVTSALAQSTVTDLETDELLRVQDGRGQHLAVFAGLVWVTQCGDDRDIFLAPGESFTMGCDGLTLVQALQASRLVVWGEAEEPIKVSATRHSQLALVGYATRGAVHGLRPAAPAGL
jgi:hypothetical protein